MKIRKPGERGGGALGVVMTVFSKTTFKTSLLNNQIAYWTISWLTEQSGSLLNNQKSLLNNQYCHFICTVWLMKPLYLHKFREDSLIPSSIQKGATYQFNIKLTNRFSFPVSSNNLLSLYFSWRITCYFMNLEEDHISVSVHWEITHVCSS